MTGICIDTARMRVISDQMGLFSAYNLSFYLFGINKENLFKSQDEI